MAKFLGLDKVAKFWNIIRANGGIRRSAFKLYRQDDLKVGTLVGQDPYGNQYFENKEYFYGRNRWVEFADHVHMDYDASQVPAEWHRWLQYMTDDPPSKVPPVKHRWMVSHIENKSGTSQAYQPYSTTRPKVQSWVPPKQKASM